MPGGCYSGFPHTCAQRQALVCLQGGNIANTGRGLYPSYGSVASSVVAEATDAVRLLEDLD